MHEPGTPFPRTPEQIRAELEKLRKDDPHGYALKATRLLREIEELGKKRKRYAIT
jgi:hypothetical protein